MNLQVTRRRFLQTGGVIAAAATVPVWAQPRGQEKAPYQVLWNDDTTNIPKWTPGEVFHDDQLRGAIDSVADKGIDAYLLSPGLGWIPWWKSRVYPDHYQWRLEKFGVKPDCFGKYLIAGGDLVSTLVSHCRKRNLAPFVSFRLNDNHHQEQRNSVWVSRFYEEHPEYLLNPRHYEKKGYSKERGQNWAIPAVRAYKLALIRELCENYDLDGLELDFLRDDTLFNLKETTEEQRVTWITDFVRAVRTALDAGPNRNRRRRLCVRIPCEIAKHGNSGIHVERFAQAGVDMFNLSIWYHTAQRTDLAKVRSLVPRAAVYLEMTHVTANRLASGYDSSAFPRTSDEQFFTTAHLAYTRGADGVSFFNLQYNKRAYTVLPRMKQRAWLAEQPQYYFLGNVPYWRQVPVTLAPGKTHGLVLEMAPPPSFAMKRIRLRVHSDAPIAAAGLEVAVNGRRLAPTSDVGAFFHNPYDGMISDPSGRMAFQASDAKLRIGFNDVSLRVISGGPLKITFVDLMVENGVS